MTLIGVALLPSSHPESRGDRLVVITLFKIVFSPISRRRRWPDSLLLAHEWVHARDLLALLLGFALLSKHSTAAQGARGSEVPADDWRGGTSCELMNFGLRHSSMTSLPRSSRRERRSCFATRCTSCYFGDRRGVERGRFGQRGRRYRHDDDVDRGRVDFGARSVRGGSGRDLHFRHSGVAAAAPLLADRARGAGGAIRIDWARVFIVAFILVVAIAVNVVSQPRVQAISGSVPVHRRRCLARHPRLRAAARTPHWQGHARARSRAPCSCCRWCSPRR